MLLTTFSPQAGVDHLTKNLRTRGAPFGLSFEKIVPISNSRLCREALECAAHHKGLDQFLRMRCESCFSQRRDIGKVDVLTGVGHRQPSIARRCRRLCWGLFCQPVIENIRQEAVRLGITTAPLFIINDQECIVGAQPFSHFRDRFRTYPKQS